MIEQIRPPDVAEVGETLTRIFEARRNPLFSLVTGVNPEPSCDVPRFVIPISDVGGSNGPMAGKRLAKAIAAEFALSTNQSCVASLALRAKGSSTPPVPDPASIANLEGLQTILSQRLPQIGLKPYAINLVTVSFGEQWSYLSLICPRDTYGERVKWTSDGGYLQLRQELLETFQVRLRVVLTTRRGGQCESDSSTAAHSSRNSWSTEESYPSSSSMAVTVSGRKQRDDWTNEHLCSVDAVQARRLEDLVGRANSLDAGSDLEDLRVCYAIAFQRGASLRPSEGVFPALGVRALIGQSGDVPSTEVKVVYARNSHALQVDQAMEMMNCAGVDDLPNNSCSQTWRRSRDLVVHLPEVVSRIHRGQMARYEVSTLCLFKDGAHSADAQGFSRIEMLVGSIMRFSQTCILKWRDRLDEPPAMLVSRPTLVKDENLQRLKRFFQCDEKDMLIPLHLEQCVAELSQKDSPDLMQALSQMLHDAQCNRRLHVLHPDEVSQPGDILPVKRGKFGFINNIQVVLAALELPPLRGEMFQLVRNASVKGRSLPEKAEERLSAEVATKRAELAQLLF